MLGEKRERRKVYKQWISILNKVILNLFQDRKATDVGKHRILKQVQDD